MEQVDLEARFEYLVSNEEWDKAANIKRCIVLGLEPDVFDMLDTPAEGAPKAKWAEYAYALGHDVSGLSKPEIQKLLE